VSVLVNRKKAPDIPIALCETTLHHILNTQRDFNLDETEEDQTKHGFSLQRSMSNLKEVGRLCVQLAQVINADDGSVVIEGVWDGEEEAIANESTRSGTIEDPYAIDIAALPTPMAAPATFQDYVNAGCHLDFSVSIDFTSSNGKHMLWMGGGSTFWFSLLTNFTSHAMLQETHGSLVRFTIKVKTF
jgi:hypothetical protein